MKENEKIITRKEAKQQKLKTYFTGKPCTAGHISERYTSNFNCISCRDNVDYSPYIEYKKKYYKNYYKNNKLLYYNASLKKNYNLTVEQYNELLKQQKYCCYICHTHQSKFKRKLAVDHSHKTGKVRGLLCIRCNTLIGNSKDNIKILESAITYLKCKNE